MFVARVCHDFEGEGGRQGVEMKSRVYVFFFIFFFVFLHQYISGGHDIGEIFVYMTI